MHLRHLRWAVWQARSACDARRLWAPLALASRFFCAAWTDKLAALDKQTPR